MAEDLTKAKVDEIITNVIEYQQELSILLDIVGRLDDVYESPLIDSRMPPGAYQYIQRAIDQLDGYIYEVGLKVSRWD